MKRWTEFSTQANLSRSLMNSLMVPAVVGAVPWKFYELMFGSIRPDTQFIYTVSNSIVLLSVMTYLVVQFVIDAASAERGEYGVVSFVLDVLALSLISFVVLSLPNTGSYTTTGYFAAGTFAVFLIWNAFYIYLRSSPPPRGGRAKVLPALNLAGALASLAAARVEGKSAGVILASTAVAFVVLWLLIPGTPEATQGKGV